MTGRRIAWTSGLALAFAVSAPALRAQSLGTFRWQLQPFCNAVIVTVTQQGGTYTAEGFDDQCGAPQRAPLIGTITPNPDGSIGIGLHVVTVPGGRGVQIDARIALASLGGPWSDSSGNTGTFAFGATTGGSPRPMPTIPAAALTPGSITASQLAPAAVTTAKIADGSVTPQKLSVGMPRLNWSGLAPYTNLPLNTDVVVGTVTLAVPAAGQVMVSASGLFGAAVFIGLPATTFQYSWCSISTGTAVETEHYMYARTDAVNGVNTLSNVPFAGTRVYSVTPGSFTVNLVCRHSNNLPLFVTYTSSVQTAQLTALFVPS